MSTFEEASALLTTTASTVMLGRYFTLSVWVLLIYDWVIHLDKEVDLYWKRPWSAAKGLYLGNRFLSIVSMGVHSIVFSYPYVTDKVCLFWYRFAGLIGLIELAVVQLILGFRILALWNHNKSVIVLVAAALLAEVAVLFGMLINAYTKMEATATVIPGVPYHACIPLDLPGYVFALWLPELGYEALVFLLAIAKGYRAIHAAFTNTGLRSVRLLEVMMRDSLWYFLIIFSCYLTCSLIWLHGPNPLFESAVGFGLAGPSLAASYMLMNLREAYYHPAGETTNGQSDYIHTGAEISRSKNYSGGRYANKAELDTSWALDSTRDFDSIDIAAHSGTTATSGSNSTPPQARAIQFLEDTGPTRQRFIEGPSQEHKASKSYESYELRDVPNTAHVHSSLHEYAS